jgi:hypothetical protein
MPEIRELLQRAAQLPTASPDVSHLWRRGQQLRRRRRAISTVVAFACLLVGGGSIAFFADDDDRETLDVVAPPVSILASTTERPTTASTSIAPSTTIGALRAMDGSVHSINDIKVVVMNGSLICGVATNYRAFVMAKGYQFVIAENAPYPVPVSMIVFADGYGPDAALLATSLNMPALPILEPQFDAMLERVAADIGVILGEDALNYVVKPEVCGDTGSLPTTTIRPTSIGPR